MTNDEEAFDLFSTSYIRVPKIEPEEIARAEAIRYASAVHMGDVPPEQMPARPSLHSVGFDPAIVAFIQEEMIKELLFGTFEVSELDPYIVWDKAQDLPSRVWEIEEPNLGPPPSGKVDQPRGWVAMNQAPRSMRKRR